jgi:hypothetical protein
MPFNVIPANRHDLGVTTNNESVPERSIVIPACFWPESRKAAWIPAFAGMTGYTFIGEPESRSYKDFWTPALRLKPAGDKLRRGNGFY